MVRSRVLPWRKDYTAHESARLPERAEWRDGAGDVLGSQDDEEELNNLAYRLRFRLIYWDRGLQGGEPAPGVLASLVVQDQCFSRGTTCVLVAQHAQLAPCRSPGTITRWMRRRRHRSSRRGRG